MIGPGQVHATVARMLDEHLPAGWKYRMKLHHRAAHKEAGELAAHDYCWHIWRPQDAEDDLSYYELEILGTAGNDFVLIYGHTDAGATSGLDRPKAALVFSLYSARRTFERIACDPDCRPNRYGYT